MHYIIGTYFKIDQTNFKLTKKYHPLKEGIYKLIYIKPVDNKFEYHFLHQIGSKVVLTFTSCKEADNFISSIRNEKLPVYTSNLD